MDKKQILVTGVNGFVGPHLVRELLSKGCSVIGVGFGSAPSDIAQGDNYSYVECNLTSLEDVATKINFTNLQAVIHLAGLSSPAISFSQPQRYVADNSAMLINLFETALKQRSEKLPRFVVVSSGAVYASSQPMPLTEDSHLAFNSPYALSKVTNENVCEYYRTRGFETVVARPFNHIGPGQGPGFLVPDLTAQVIAAGANGTITVGDLSTRRDFSDVRDVVKAYAEIALAPEIKHSLYNVCSGKSRSGQELLNAIVVALFGKDTAVHTEIDQSRIRPNDPPEIVGSSDRLHEDFGWSAAIPLDQTIHDYLEWAKQDT